MTTIKPLAQSIAVIALSAMALDTAYAAIEEVTVTAQRRAQNIQDVPLAITALSEEELQERQIDEPMTSLTTCPICLAATTRVLAPPMLITYAAWVTLNPSRRSTPQWAPTSITSHRPAKTAITSAFSISTELKSCEGRRAPSLAAIPRAERFRFI